MFFRLVKINFQSLFQSSFSKSKKSNAGLMVLFVFVFAYIIAAMALGAWGQAQLYLQNQMPTYGLLITGALPTTILVFVLSFFGLHHMLFSATDYELLASMPIKPSTVCFARIFTQCIWYYVYVLMFYAPYLVVYCIVTPITFLQVLIAITILLALPLLPITFGELFALCIGLIGSNTKVFRVVRGIVIALVMVAMVLLYSGFGQGSITLPNVFFFTWIVQSVAFVSWGSVFAFWAISILPFVVLLLCISKYYSKLYERFHRTPKAKHAKPVNLHKRTQFQVLLKKEWQRLTSSAGYLLNSCLGFVFYICMPVVLYVAGVQNMGFNVLGAFCLAIAMLGMNSPLAVTFSLEGNAFYIVKSLPISTKTYIQSKVTLQLCIMLPFAIVGSILCSILMHFVWYEWLLLLLFSLGFSVLVTGYALFLAKRFYTFSYTNEIQVVKQSGAVLYHTLTCFAFLGVVLGVCIGAMYLMPLWIPLTVITLVTCVGGWVLLYKQMQVTAWQLNEIM